MNGGFEKVFGNFAKDWRLECWQEPNAFCSYQVDPKIKRGGRYSAKIEHQGKADSRWTQEVRLNPGAEYKLSGWIKTVNVARVGMGAFIQVEGANLRTQPIHGTSDWQYVETVGRAGLDQTQAKIQCRLGDYGAPNTGTAYFDDLQLIELKGDQR